MALAVLVCIGAVMARPVPLSLGVGLVVVALSMRRPALLWLGAALVASTLGYRAEAGLVPVRAAPFSGTVTLVADPVDGLGATTAFVTTGGRRLELVAHDRGRGELRTRLAGERMRVVGRTRPPPPGADWLSVKHVVGRLDAATLSTAGAGALPWRAANRVRRLLVAGASSMPPDRRALFTGFVLGDDRDQPATVTDDFRGSGLTHLLVVSGENVAFVLALAGPVLRRLRLGPRWLATLTVVGSFALVTRFEPSVLRAAVMAGLAATAFALGRPASGVRLLALAVAGLVLVDPLLVRSVGFRLSVAASAGIVVIGPVLRRLLPGPRWLVEPLAVTGGAQLGVAPLLVATFGGVPVASLPANLLAGPAAGLVMMWGLGAGLPAGVLGGGAATLLHRPTSWLIAYIATVAAAGARLPLGELRAGHVVALGIAMAMALASRHVERPGLRALALALAGVSLLAPALELRRAPPTHVVAGGADLWRAGGGTVVLVGGRTSPTDLLEGLRRAGVRRIDLLVLPGGGASAAGLLTTVAHRWPPTEVWAPVKHEVPSAKTPPANQVVPIGGLSVTVVEVRPALVVTVARSPPTVQPGRR